MSTPQAFAAAIAVIAFGALLAFSRKLNIRPWALAASGVAGVALAALAGVLVSRAASLSALAAGVGFTAACGALAAAAASIFIRRSPRMSGLAVEARLLRMAGAPSVRVNGAPAFQGGGVQAPVSQPAVRQVMPEPPAEQDAAPEPQPEIEYYGESSIERLTRLFRKEQERLAREEEMCNIALEMPAPDEEDREGELRRAL